MKIAVAMSGGVDSSVAAALLAREGHEVIGLTMQLLPGGDGDGTGYRRDAIESARQAACQLGIPHHVIDFHELFAHKVMRDFYREYRVGRTPNPCVLCNNHLKFGALWEKAAGLGADRLATGHYARVDGSGAAIRLRKGRDSGKDQSYFLCRLTRGQLGSALFPLGGLTKVEVRQIARDLGLPAASRPESREICFIPDHDYARFIENSVPPAPGPILDENGNVLGGHRGIAGFTIGQRHRLGVAAAAPLYVTAIRPENNAVVVGPKAQTFSRELIATDLNWIAIIRPESPINIKAKVRYRHAEAPATVTPMAGGHYYVKFTTPQMAITPGQTIAFYDGDNVIGGGVIVSQGR